jgi:tetratricopeptide (TPR) repeat protein
MTDNGSWRRQWIPIAGCALLFVLTLLLYAPVLQYGFVDYDDPLYVTQNGRVQQGLTGESIRWAFQFGPGHAFNYHPLTWLSHMLDAQLYGPKAGLHHLTSIILHAAASIALLWFLWIATQRWWPSFAAAALFAWHPMHVESVAWVAERKDVLSALLMFLMLLAYVRYTRSEKRTGWYLLVVALFTIGLLAKAMLVTVPFVLLLLDYWPLKRPWSKSLLLEKVPLFAIAIAMSVVTYLAQKLDGGLQSDETCPAALRWMNVPVAYVRYLAKLAWPANLSVFYPYCGWATWQVAAATAMLIAITVVVIMKRRRGYVLVGWLWFLGMLVPVIGIVQAGMQSMADRYSYLPSVGLFIAVCFALDDWATTMRQRWVAKGILSILLIACIVVTLHQIQFWRDEVTLFTRAATVDPQNYLAEGRIARALAPRDAKSAFEHYLRSLDINPDHFDARYNLGNLLLRYGRVREAIEQYRRAVALRPRSIEANGNLGIALGGIGDLVGAEQSLRAVIALDPHTAPAREALGEILLKLRRNTEAAEQFRAALAIAPNMQSARDGLAQATIAIPPPATQP